jgi:GNAT superfamily N-acetyltransferase
MQVQIAGLSQLREVVDYLIGKFHASYASVLPPVEFSKVVLYIGKHLNDGVVFTARNDKGELIGVIAGMVSSPWFSAKKHVSEGVFFVSPEARGTGVAADLLRHLKVWAADKNMALMCGVTTGDDLERKDQFFDRNGLVRIGGIYRTKDE